ncbi:MAG: flagellar filament capping protein FliD, partial [Acidobacteria bacterium]|nr:flagellar filament capping protein FliD [Acidobacteriota bacterium]
MASPINFSGAASGLDTNLIIDALLSVKQQKVSALKSKVSTLNLKRSSLDDLKGVLNSLKDKADKLGQNVLGKRSTQVSDSDIFTATADSNAQVGDYSIVVNNLAQQSTATVGGKVAAASEIIGAGTLTIDTDGGNSYSVTLTDPNSTLADLRQAITDQHGAALNANVIEVTPGQFQLAVTSKTAGANQNIAVSSNYSGFSTSANFAASGVTNTQIGEDADITVDGINIKRTSNKIDDVISGVTLQLKQESAVTQSLSVAVNNDDVVKGLQEFADAYNSALDKINELSGIGGRFSGDSSLRNIKSELQKIATRFVSNVDQINQREGGETGFTALSQIGFKTDQKTGKLSIDTTVLKDALTDHFDEVVNLFGGGSKSSNANISVLTSPITPFSGAVSLDTINDTATIGGQTYNLTRNGNILSFGSDT